MKVAVFGGSFDPPHMGHDLIVKSALKSLDIDKLLIVPTYINPFKSHFVADESTRLNWVRTLWGGLQKVEILDYETAAKRPVPSIESVEYIEKKFKPKKIYFIIGADHLKSLNSWHNYEKLAAKVEFIVATRGQIAVPKGFKVLDINENIASSMIREHLKGDKSLLKRVPEAISGEVEKFYTQGDLMQERVARIVKILDEKKAEDVQSFDMRGREYFADFVVLATSLTERHALSLMDELKTQLKPLGEEFLSVESSEEWSVLDLGDIIIHLLSAEYRSKYNIEELLKDLQR